jgi:hypothetical protein
MQYCLLHHTRKTFTTGCCMKKFGINIQMILRYTACVAGLQDLTPSAIFFNINQHLFSSYLTSKKDVIFNNNSDFIRELVNKKIPNVFNCQNKHYEKNCHFEKLDGAI